MQLHVVTRDMVWVGMHLLKFFSVSAVDLLIKLASYIRYGDLSKYGIHRPKNGPFSFKALRGRGPVIDGGTIAKIRKGEIKVFQFRSYSLRLILFEFILN